MIELLLLAGVLALAILAAVSVVFLLSHRRQGTVRAVFMPRKRRDDGT